MRFLSSSWDEIAFFRRCLTIFLLSLISRVLLATRFSSSVLWVRISSSDPASLSLISSKLLLSLSISSLPTLPTGVARSPEAILFAEEVRERSGLTIFLLIIIESISDAPKKASTSVMKSVCRLIAGAKISFSDCPRTIPHGAMCKGTTASRSVGFSLS